MANDTIGGFGGVLAPRDERLDPNTKFDPRVASSMRQEVAQNRVGTLHLIESQRRSLKEGTTCRIYNYSPIFPHSRRTDGFGVFLIPRAPRVGSKIIDKKTGKERSATVVDIAGDYRLSEPLVINHSYVRSCTSLNEGNRIPYVEYGEDIAESIVGCSTKYPLGLTSEKAEYSKNLKNWGVFIVYGGKFEDLPQEEQQKILNEAHAAHTERCIEKVNRADMLYSTYKMRGKGGPLKIHHECAEWLRENIDPSFADREWITQRGNTGNVSGKVECPFCGSMIKATVAICPNCKNIVDADKYERLTKSSKKAESPAQKPQDTKL